MKQLSKSISCILLLLTMCFFAGCQAKESPVPVDYDSLTELPVLTIETKSKAADVMDFVTSPVAAHVAESIASWTPGYVMPPAPYYEACTVSLSCNSKSIPTG